MNSQEISITHNALGWVKKSIDDNLSEIKTELKLYIEEDDATLLEGVKERLGIIQGVLMMIEQYGAAMLTEEMVALADFIMAKKQAQGDQALEVLLRAVLQLPDYLEHIQSGHRDIPIAILPLLNDIRAVRNQDLFSEKLLFLPDLSVHQEDAEIEAIDEKSNQATKLLAKKLRPVYQLALVNVIKEQAIEESLKRLGKICEILEERSVSEQIARIWWIVGALIESVSRQQLELGVSIKNLLGKVDALFRVILIIGERGLLQRQPIELIKNFLYYVAQPECDGPKTQAIKTAYRLEQFLPSESARSEVLDNIAGPNQALLKTVAEAMKADIEAVKSTLEVYVNGDLSEVFRLKDLPKEMHIISDTLAMIGLGAQRQLIEAQIDVVKEVIAGNQAADEEQLLSMAAELLQVEQALDQMQKRQPAGTEQPRSETDVSRDYELDSVLTAVVTAALDDIQKTKNAILEFIKDSSRGENIDLCVALMKESRGALHLLNRPRAVAVVDGLLTYLQGYDIIEFMESNRLDALSQVVASLEYYLEALGEHRSDASSILDFADVQLRELLSNVQIRAEVEGSQEIVIAAGEFEGGADVSADTINADQKPAATETRAEAQSEAELKSKVDSGPTTDAAEPENGPDSVELEIKPEPIVTAEMMVDQEAVEPPQAVVPSSASLGQEPESSQVLVDQDPVRPEFASAKAITAEVETVSVPVDTRIEIVAVDEALEVLKPGSDSEILEIYLEEAEEEALNIARLQQDWMLHPEDENAVKNIRRAFHTIKGSGRLVGAMKIGEFAWDFEQLLNRVLDKTVPPDRKTIDAVGKAAKALLLLVNEIKTSEPPQTDINYLRGLARALAEFKAEQLLIEHTQQISIVESPHDRITDDDDNEWKGIGIGETTQVIPPDKLTAALLEEIEPDTMRVDSSKFETADLQDEDAADATQAAATSFDDTPLPQSPAIPSSPGKDAGGAIAETVVATPIYHENDYKQAIDYTHSAAESADAGVAGIEAVEIDGGELAIQEDIKIETIGEDFLGDEVDHEIEDEFSIDALAPEVSIAETASEDELEFEDLSTVEEAELEVLTIEAPEAEVEEVVFDLLEPEVEEIVMETSQPEAQAVEVDAPAIQREPESRLEASEPEIEMSGSDEMRQETVQEIPPDPLVDTTRGQMPGEEEAGSSVPRDREPPEQIGLSFDPELLTIYQQEVEQHLGIVSSVLDRSEQTKELIPNEEIYRALHTINGASRTADISTIGELAALMEKPLKLAISQKLALDHEIVALYREGQFALRNMTSELVATRQLPAIPEDLGTSLRALAEDFEEHTVEIPEDGEAPAGDFVDTLTMMNEAIDTEPDNELLIIFVDEANELLEMSDNTLHQWTRQKSDETDAPDFSAVMELQRYLHTLKGGARMAELKQISDLSHEMESLFIAVIDGRVDKNEKLVELLKDCFDLLHRQVVEAQGGRDMGDPARLIGLLKTLRRGKGDENIDDLGGVDMDSEDIDIVSENLPGDPISSMRRPSQDVIKVRADLLDNLVSSAGEVSIYRARMEQQVAGLGSHLSELGQTISRLKGQLRNLEAETDAQIHFSHRAEAGNADEFDPLEMDRYTMIQELSRSLGESVNDLSSLQAMLGEQVKDSETLLLQQSRVSTDLQDGLIKSRMVKFSGLLSRLRRLVRQSSQELGKKADLIISGEENEVDNKVLDRMVAPLEHIIRNALSHGIETPVERVKKGKAEAGKIAIDISRDGSDIIICIKDDGAGVNLEKVRSRAVQLGLLDPKHQVTEADLVQYILEPGFSTAEHVTQLSGRGVGMDIVDIEIKQLGGTLQIETTPRGTTFTARLPFTLSINQAILVRTGEEIYAIPLINIEGITRLDAQQVVEYYRQEEPELEYAGQRFALYSLAKLVETGIQFRPGAENEKQVIVLSRSGDVRVAMHVDEIIGNREIVVKTLGKQLSQVKGLAGASILADGSVVLILDINGLVRHSTTSAVKIVYHQQIEKAPKTRETVMVVDDSITMRRVASKLLERHNYDVVTAKDGVDALAQLQDVRPDVMLLDIEMPRMDGFELATHMQNEENFSRIPIIMITSRTGEKHRDRALQIGVTNYMGKPYQEDELVENIQSALATK